MRVFRPDTFLNISALLNEITVTADVSKTIFEGLGDSALDAYRRHDHFFPNEQNIKKFCRAMESWAETFEELGFVASAATAQKLTRIAGADDVVTHAGFLDLVAELWGRLRDEMSGANFMSLTPLETRYYARPREGWDEILLRFPAAADDVEEAAKCYALSRYAAAVFHSVQVVEFGLIDLGRFLQVNDPISGWTAVANELKRIIGKKYADRTDFEKTHYPLLEQLYGTVEALKNAWRNKVSHAHGKLFVMTTDFSAEVSEEIMFASRAFMRRLTDGLPRQP